MNERPARRALRLERRSGRTRARARRVGAVLLAFVVVLALVGTVGPLLAIHGGAEAGAAPAPSCPKGSSDGAGGCAVQLPCEASYVGCDPAHPPTVDVNPVFNLHDAQYVTVTATNFPTTWTDNPTNTNNGKMRVAYCSTAKSSDPANPTCLTGQWEGLTSYIPVTEPVDTAGSNDQTSLSYPVFLDPPNGGAGPMKGREINHGVSTPFVDMYCDAAADPCAIEVTVEEGNGPSLNDTTSNTVVMPIDFAPTAVACPLGKFPPLSSEGSFSVDKYLYTAVTSTCSGTNGVIDLNTSTDTKTVATSLAGSATELGFLDNPGDPAEQAILSGGKTSYAYIPVAVSATEVAFLATLNQNFSSQLQLLNSYALTPAMLAGLTTSAYQSPTVTDSLVGALQKAGLHCAQIVVCKSGGTNVLDVFDLLNPLPTGGEGPQTLGSYMPGAPSGAEYEATNWICDQPKVPLTLDLAEVGQTGTVPVKVTDPVSAGTVLVTQPTNTNVPNLSWTWPTPTCSAQSTLPPAGPPVGSTGNNVQFAQFQEPQKQASQVRGYVLAGGEVPPGGANAPSVGFAVMDSSQADFYGLDAARLENALGNFESPTATTIADALKNLTPCPSGQADCPVGTYMFDYTAAGKAGTYPDDAYPMPDITYAVVPTSPQAPDKAAAMKNLVTNLVDFSNSAGPTELPPGYYALPDTLKQDALADIKKDIVAKPTPTTTTTTTVKSKKPTTGATSVTTTPSANTTPVETTVPSDSAATNVAGETAALPASSSSSPNGSGPTSRPTSSTTTTTAPAGSPSGPAATNTSGTLLVSVAASRFFVPVIAALAALSLLTGIALLMGADVGRIVGLQGRRRRRTPRGAP